MPKQIARLHYLHIAPRKVRAVGDLVKGLSVNEAEAQLMFERRRAAKALLKLLRSAVANAKHAKGIDADRLYIEKLTVDQGPMLKRYLPRARGMVNTIQKKMSHVTLVLSENPKLAPPRFKIMLQKKTKLPPEERPKKKGKEKESKELRKETPTTLKSKKPGFLRRVFSRKSRMGE